jgi:thymidylate synthase (FAD)
MVRPATRDPRFRVDLIFATPNPQQCIYAAMHQDYSEGFVAADRADWPDETRAGEICVKRLLAGERGHYGCYSADTEVLTEAGWTPWPDVTTSTMLAAVDISSGAVNFEVPTAIQCIPIKEGDSLYSFESQRLSLAVTQDHRMAISSRKSTGWSQWRFEPASSVAGKAVRYRLAGNLKKRSIPDDCPQGVDLVSLFKVAGFFFGDGCRSQSKDPKCLRFRLRRARKIAYLKSCGFAVKETKGDRFVLRDATVSRWIHKHFQAEEGKRVPSFIMSLPEGLFQAFADGLKNSDGTAKRQTWAFDSVEKAALDVIQAAFHLNNQAASLTLNNSNEGDIHKNHKPCWRLHVSSREPYARAEVNQQGRTRGTEKLIPYEGNVYCATVSTGALLVRRNNKPVVCGNCLEHPSITLNTGWFPHSVLQQARTHRVGISFDCQSLRYTGKRISQVANGELDAEEVFYLRPVGSYSDRKGKKYSYTQQQRDIDLALCRNAARRYDELIQLGYAEEHARGILPFDYRQHFVVSFSLRAFLHFLDLRAKLDAQEEIRALCDLMWPHLQAWTPEIAAWYESARLHKARLAP